MKGLTHLWIVFLALNPSLLQFSRVIALEYFLPPNLTESLLRETNFSGSTLSSRDENNKREFGKSVEGSGEKNENSDILINLQEFELQCLLFLFLSDLANLFYKRNRLPVSDAEIDAKYDTLQKGIEEFINKYNDIYLKQDEGKGDKEWQANSIKRLVKNFNNHLLAKYNTKKINKISEIILPFCKMRKTCKFHLKNLVKELKKKKVTLFSQEKAPPTSFGLEEEIRVNKMTSKMQLSPTKKRKQNNVTKETINNFIYRYLPQKKLSKESTKSSPNKFRNSTVGKLFSSPTTRNSRTHEKHIRQTLVAPWMENSYENAKKAKKENPNHRHSKQTSPIPRKREMEQVDSEIFGMEQNLCELFDPPLKKIQKNDKKISFSRDEAYSKCTRILKTSIIVPKSDEIQKYFEFFSQNSKNICKLSKFCTRKKRSEKDISSGNEEKKRSWQLKNIERKKTEFFTSNRNYKKGSSNISFDVDADISHSLCGIFKDFLYIFLPKDVDLSQKKDVELKILSKGVTKIDSSEKFRNKTEESENTNEKILNKPAENSQEGHEIQEFSFAFQEYQEEKKTKKKNERKRRDTRRARYQIAESAPHFRFTPIDQTVTPGSPISLKCSSIGSPLPIISWTRDDEPLIPTIRTQVGSIRSPDGEVVSYVNISDVQSRDGGLFRCTAHNSAGMVTHTSKLNVYGPPFVRPMMNSSVVAGNDINIWCAAGGFPVPKVTWQFLGQPLPLSLRHEIVDNHTLIIREAKESDQGRYTCIAKNRGGQSAMGDTFLHVSNPPIIEQFNFAPNLKEGHRTHLTCMLTSGDLPVTIQWLKDGHHLSHDPDVEQKKMSDYSMVLLFKRLNERHSGKYTCVAANAAASSNHTAQLDVKVPPKWIISPSDLSVSVGGMVKLQCMARGVPEPSIVWSKSSDVNSRDFQRVIEEGRRLTVSKNGTLSILNVLKSDAATYLCQASNGIGSPLSKIAKISVSARPEISSIGGRLTGHSGRSVKLECAAKGDSPMTINWRRGHQLLIDSQRISVTKFNINEDSISSVLTFNAARPSDAGQYICEAVNDHGQHTKIYNLIVLEPPLAPSNLKVNEVSSRSVKVSWSASQSSKITIQIKKGTDNAWSENGRNVSLKNNESDFVVPNLSPFSKYSVRLFAANELGVSSPSEAIEFLTEEEAPSGSPRNIRVSSVEPRALQISWNPPLEESVNGIIRGYVIAIRKQNIREDFRFIARPAFQDASQSSTEEYVVRGLIPSTLYEVALRVFNRIGLGPLSSPRIVQSTMFEAPGCPPSGLSCKGDSLSGIRIWWETPQPSCAKAPVTGYSILATPTEKHQSQTGSLTKEVFTTNLEKNLGTMPSSSNISVIVRAYNSMGFSPPSRSIFCKTLDNVPQSPQRLRVASSESGSFIAIWLPPEEDQRFILRYTLYYEYNNKVRHILVQNSDVDSSWKKLSGFQNGERITVWITASTSAGEGSPTPKTSFTLMSSSSYGPFAVSSQTLWKVSENFAVTLRCRAIGHPRPSITWLKDNKALRDDLRHQILPGGDLHLIPESSSNYTCRSSSSLGEDKVLHQVIVLSTPSKPVIRVNEAYRTSLNISVGCLDDGGAPILGYKLYEKRETGEWKEQSIAVISSISPTNFLLRNLPCGSDIHFYATAWNSQGVSSPSDVFTTTTRGSLPPRPQPSTLVEVNASCVTLRLYAWPENGCPVLNWKVEGKHENANEWKTIFSNLGREARDVAFCDLQRTEAYLLKIIAYSEAGPTKVTYKVSLQDVYSGWAASEYVQEILMGSDAYLNNWLDAHVVAGIVSAILLTTAIVICTCVIFRKKYFERERTTTTTTLKEKESNRFSHQHLNNLSNYHVYSPLPSKKVKNLISSEVKRKRSRSSLVSYGGPDEDILSGEDIYPYATFSAGSADETLQYGISLHTRSPSSRDCFEGSQSRDEDIYSSRTERIRPHYKESNVSYPPSKLLISERGDRSRPSSKCLENSESASKTDGDKLSEATTMPISEKVSREKASRPVNRIQDVISPIPTGNRSNISSPVHLNYNQSVPVQTLYSGHLRNNGSNREIISSSSGRHAR